MKINQELIKKYFQKQCTYDELVILRKWFSSEEGQQFISHSLLEEELHFSLSSKENLPFDSMSLLTKINHEIEILERRSWRVILMRVAAVLFIPLLGYTLYLQWGQQAQSPVQWQQYSAGYGEIGEFLLPDSSQVQLNAGSSLIYPSHFEGKERKVFLTGEGFFMVRKNSKKPFTVTAENLIVKVTGTSFNLKSHTTDSLAEVRLLEGSVQVMTANGRREVALKPGERLLYNKKRNSMTLDSFAVGSYLSWTQGYLSFRDRQLREIVDVLKRRFNTDIIIDDETLNDQRFYLTFANNESLDEILAAIDIEGKLLIRKRGETLYISRKPQ